MLRHRQQWGPRVQRCEEEHGARGEEQAQIVSALLLRHGDEHHTGRAHGARAEEEGASLCSRAKFGQCLRGGAPKFSRTVRKPSAPAVRTM